MEGGWVKLPRSLLDDAVFLDERLLRLLVWCMLRANHTAQQFHGELIGVGEFVTSMERAAEFLGCAKSTVWRGLEKLASPDMGYLRLRLVANAKRKFTVVSVIGQTGFVAADKDSRNGEETVAERERNGDETGAKQIRELRIGEGENKSPQKPPAGAGAEKPPKSRFDPSTVAIPANLDTPEFQGAWADWIAHRREIKKTLTARSCAEQLKVLSQAGSTAAVTAIRESITNTWIGLFPGGKQNGRSAAPGPGQRFDPDRPIAATL